MRESTFRIEYRWCWRCLYVLRIGSINCVDSICSSDSNSSIIGILLLTLAWQYYHDWHTILTTNYNRIITTIVVDYIYVTTLSIIILLLLLGRWYCHHYFHCCCPPLDLCLEKYYRKNDHYRYFYYMRIFNIINLE